MALQWSTLSIPLAAGLDQKGDARAHDPPTLDICTNAQFDDIGALQTRYPFASIGNSIFGGGTLSNARKLAVNGDELLCFTRDALYSWSPQLSKWVRKGTHLAAELSEETVFATTGDQIDCDRAELSGVAIYTWTDAGSVYAAARDKTTGAVLVAPTAIALGSRPRIVALTTKLLLFAAVSGGGLLVRAIDPADPATGFASVGTAVSVAGFNDIYDVTQVIGSDKAIGVARLTPTTSYLAFTVTASLTVATSTKARTSTAAMAIACSPTGTQAQVVRCTGGSPNGVTGDLLTVSTLADVFTNQSIGSGTTLKNVAAAYRDTQDSGQYRCYAFWTDVETDSGLFNVMESRSNWADTGGTLGTEAVFIRQAGIGSRAFAYDGHVYVWLAFGNLSGFDGSGPGSNIVGSVQNAYYLYRDDSFLTAKAVYNVGGGLVATEGLLPGVALTSGSKTFSWCAVERRRIVIGPGSGGGVSGDGEAYAMRAPRDVSVTFDSDAARRCARLGQTLYIASGEVLQYDSSQIVECGFHTAPWFYSASLSGAGDIPNGTYAYQLGFRWLNARGEIDRSTSGVIGNITVSGGPKLVDVEAIYPLTFTHKGNAPAVQIWRTAVNPTADSPFYLATSLDPADTAGANAYLANNTASTTLTIVTDDLTDEDLTVRESHPETGGILESLAPPAASVIMATQDRLFLAGIAGDRDRVWYSKARGDGEVVSFHDALTIAVPHAGGAITALGVLNETLIVFRETAIYAFPGDGYANDGSGSNYGPARPLSTDIGAVNAESIATIEQGLVFKSSKGWYVLNRGWGLDYIGAAVCDYDDEVPLAAQVLTSKHQVRLLTASRMLVWDYLINQWGEWTISDGLSAVLWNDTHHYLTSTTIKAEQTTYSSVDYGMDVETAWIKLDGLQGFGRVRKIVLLGEYRSDHVVRIRVARDYQATATEVWSYFDDQRWTVAPTVVGGTEQLRIGPSQQQCQAIKIRITIERYDSGTASYVVPNGEAVKLTGLALEVGLKRGPYPMLPSTQKL